MFGRSKRKSEADALLLTELVHPLAFWRRLKLQDLQQDFEHLTMWNGVTLRIHNVSRGVIHNVVRGETKRIKLLMEAIKVEV